MFTGFIAGVAYTQYITKSGEYQGYLTKTLNVKPREWPFLSCDAKLNTNVR